MSLVDGADRAPVLAVPPRPARPLSALALIKMARRNSLAVCDEALFDELFVERSFLGQRVVIVSDPAGIKRVLLDNFDNYPRLPQFRRMLEPGLGSGLLASEGEVWRRHRRLVAPTIDARATLPEMSIMTELTEELARYWATLPAGGDIDIGRQIAFLISVAMGRMFAGDDPAVVSMLQCLSKYPRNRRVLDFVPLPLWARQLLPESIEKEAHSFDAMLARLIDERRHPDYAGRHDLIWRLAHAEDRRTGEKLSAIEVRDEIVTLASGSIDTTTRVLTWIWYLLAMHPWAEARLHAELDEVLGGRTPAPADLPRLVYTRKVIDETMRLYPPIPVLMRTAAADDVICGRRVRKRSLVGVMPFVVHRHRKLWPNPERFDPERFAPENTATRERFSYLPFCLGPRICVGASLAQMQVPLIVATLAQRFRYRLVPHHPVTPVGWITLRPDHGIRVTLERR